MNAAWDWPITLTSLVMLNRVIWLPQRRQNELIENCDINLKGNYNIMRLFLFVAVTLAVVSSLAQAADTDVQVPTSTQREWAQKLAKDTKKRADCLRLVKEELGDPKSLKVQEWGAAHNAMQEYVAMHMSRPDRFVYPAKVRVRNKFGGLQTATLKCYFGVSGGDVSSLQAASIDFR